MSEENEKEKTLLAHHEQQSLCTSRLPYRQGRKLTAVKVYTINDESNHLLVFGVPSLKLRQETKALFCKFGKLLKFTITTDYPTEAFTENYHAVFENIQSARIAKKMLDTKNFYGGSLHICYAPELEDINETRNKLLKRQKDVLNRLRNLQRENEEEKSKAPKNKINTTETTKQILPKETPKLNMGEINIIGVGRQIRDVVFNKGKRKQTRQNTVVEKKFKPCFEETTKNSRNTDDNGRNADNNTIERVKSTNGETKSNKQEIEIIDFTSVQNETISNINEALNYNKFGNEVIKKIPEKPVNKIKFYVGNKR